MILYIHIPFCIKKCRYCDFNSYKIDTELKKIYLKSLVEEIKIYSTHKKISSVYIGGGTPSILSTSEINNLFEELYKYYLLDKSTEISMECNPGTLNEEKLKIMKNVGINRISIGLQAIQEKHLNYLGRIHTYQEFLKNYIEAQKLGFRNINIDLMYSLPNQTLEDWYETLSVVTSLNPTHISAYSLILEEGTEFYSMFENGQFVLNDELIDIKMYRYTINFLMSKGYKHYEISNYSKEGFECRHNIGYWKCEEYIGLGAGASGHLDSKRYKNFDDLKKYNNKILNGCIPINEIENISTKDKLEEKIFMGLRMNEGIKYLEFVKLFGIDLKVYFKKEIEKLKSNGLLVDFNDGIKLTQKGREISNSVFLEFIK